MRPYYFEKFVPTTAGAYSANNVVGGLIQIPYPGGQSGRWVLKNLYIVDKANQGAELFVNILRSKPVGTFTDQAALSWGTGDVDLLVCSVEVLAATYKTQNAVAIANTAYSVGGFSAVPLTSPTVDDSSPNLPFLYVVMTTTGTPTYGAGTDKIRIAGCLLRDAT